MAKVDTSSFLATPRVLPWWVFRKAMSSNAFRLTSSSLDLHRRSSLLRLDRCLRQDFHTLPLSSNLSFQSIVPFSGSTGCPRRSLQCCSGSRRLVTMHTAFKTLDLCLGRRVCVAANSLYHTIVGVVGFPRY